VPRGVFRNLTGLKFGAWTVLNLSHRSESRKLMWMCACECGTSKPVQGANLLNGKSKGCRDCYVSRHRSSVSTD
jgi:hypothetical protein